MIDKRPIRPERLRQVPSGFSWVDHRLIRHRPLEDCAHAAWALYLFLVTVGDAQGLSYYSDSSVMKRLSMGETGLREARESLIGLQLIAYVKPLYQVLSLDSNGELLASRARTPMDQPMSFGQVLKKIAGDLS